MAMQKVSPAEFLAGLPVADPSEGGGNWPNGTFETQATYTHTVLTFFSPAGVPIGRVSIEHKATGLPVITCELPLL